MTYAETLSWVILAVLLGTLARSFVVAWPRPVDPSEAHARALVALERIHRQGRL